MQEVGGSIARQIAKLANGIILYHRCHAQFVNRSWPGRKQSSFLWVQILFLFLFFSGLWTCTWVWSFFQEFHRIFQIRMFCVLHSLPRDSLCNWSLGGEKKNCIVCSLFCILIFLIIIISSSSSSICLCCFLKLSLSEPTSFTFCPYVLLIPLWEEEEQWASGCLVFSFLVASCWVKPQQCLKTSLNRRLNYISK